MRGNVPCLDEEPEAREEHGGVIRQFGDAAAVLYLNLFGAPCAEDDERVTR